MNGDEQKNHRRHASLRSHDSYSYAVDEEKNGEIYCSFATDECEYTVYFNPDEYRKRIADYPSLLKNAYGFGFFSFPQEGIKIPKIDSKIKHTIEQIICDFYDDNPDGVLLYHCYFADGKQHKRSKKFERWYCGSSSKEAIRKHEISLEILTNGAYVTHYIGYLCSNANKNLEHVHQEFENFGLEFRDDKVHL